MGTRLLNKIGVVTGSTSGIGAAIAQALAEEGARVVVSGRREGEGEKVVAGVRGAGGQAVFQKTDLTAPDECARLCRRAQEEFGGLDILVNNAGLFPRASFDDTTLELWDELFAVNVRGAFLCSQAAAPLMRQRGGGSIINIGSCHAFATGGNLFAYGCTKGALYVLTMNMARCLAKDRIRVNWITVGWVLTEKELEVQAKEGRDLEWLKQNEAQRPMGRYNTAEEIAAGCVYLASDDAQNVTAANLNVSGGMSIRV